MKKTLFLVFIGIILTVSNLRAQDLIVTHSGDSIHCKITKITKEYVHFIFKHNEEIRSTLLPTNQVITQQKDYFTVSELPASYTYKAIFPHFRVAIDGGGQFRTAKLASGMDREWRTHYKKMKAGFHYEMQAAYFFLESQGVEIMFSQQLFGNSIGNNGGGSSVGSGRLNETIAFNYIGANYVLRLLNATKKNCWLFSTGLGYMGYVDRAILDNIEHTKITASTLCTNMSIGYDIGLSKNLGIGFKLSLMGGTFSNYKQTTDGITTKETMPDKTMEGLGTIKLSVGLRFNR